MRLRIRTPSRLHFGLLGFPSSGGRAFGGAGLMIDEPAIEIEAWLDAEAVTRPVGGLDAAPSSVVDRAARIRDTIVRDLDLPDVLIPILVVRSSPEEHVGLGVGTQLSLAIACAVTRLADRPMSLERLAGLTGRGRRSAIGVHGFAHGGLVVDGGKGPRTRLAPMVARLAFPDDWPIVLIGLPLPAGRHGPREEDAFDQDPPIPSATTELLSEILLRRLLPAVVERDREAFNNALARYNRAAGECFSRVQGGPYAHTEIQRLVAWLDDRGVPAAQSSWGPTVFCVLEDFELARRLALDVQSQFNLPTGAARITVANNAGAEVSETASTRESGDPFHASIT